MKKYLILRNFLQKKKEKKRLSRTIFLINWHLKDGSVGPVFRYQEHFIEILGWGFNTHTSLVNIYNGIEA